MLNKATKPQVMEIPPILRASDIRRIFSISTSYLYKSIDNGSFPRPRKRGKIAFWTADMVLPALRTWGDGDVEQDGAGQ